MSALLYVLWLETDSALQAKPWLFYKEILCKCEVRDNKLPSLTLYQPRQCSGSCCCNCHPQSPGNSEWYQRIHERILDEQTSTYWHWGRTSPASDLRSSNSLKLNICNLMNKWINREVNKSYLLGSVPLWPTVSPLVGVSSVSMYLIHPTIEKCKICRTVMRSWISLMFTSNLLSSTEPAVSVSMGSP